MNKPQPGVRKKAFQLIGQLLQERQRELKIPVEHMAAAGEMSKQTIYNIFNGQPGTMEQLFKIFQMLDMHIDIYPKEIGKFDNLMN